MSVVVHLPTVLRSHAGGTKSVTAEGSTIGQVLSSLATQYPGLSGQVVNQEGTLHKFVNVYLDDDDVRYLSGLETPVAEGNEISILPAVAGGAVASGAVAGPHDGTAAGAAAAGAADVEPEATGSASIAGRPAAGATPGGTGHPA